MFIAGVVPGLLMMLSFMIAIGPWVWLRPDNALASMPMTDAQRIGAVKKTRAFVALFAVLPGGIYAGVFTRTEAASVGAMGAWVFACARGSMRSGKQYREVIGTAVGINASIFAIGVPCVLLGMVFEALGVLVLIVPMFPSGAAGAGHRSDLIRRHHPDRTAPDHAAGRCERLHREGRTTGSEARPSLHRRRAVRRRDADRRRADRRLSGHRHRPAQPDASGAGEPHHPPASPAVHCASDGVSS